MLDEVESTRPYPGSSHPRRVRGASERLLHFRLVMPDARATEVQGQAGHSYQRVDKYGYTGGNLSGGKLWWRAGGYMQSIAAQASASLMDVRA
jgi:hypothetical protein